ncbi:hypothetical protein SAMN06297229_0959 [Pseudidiomarina planktonica]|uniref:Uncharacterized protein n=1 Tax=Pseudidiomarina planktonica TaxID=1323738 RepID=A0A1Y6ENE1_9GAMM|nr:hypothetical protein [Pseudidiomarina planktonica]SMQ64087.1 hypothetical protein SAMN06297229_0959 [Pseudidiomarina planktonica]
MRAKIRNTKAENQKGQASTEAMLLLLFTVALWFSPGMTGADNLWVQLTELIHGWLRFYQWVWQHHFILPGVV